MNQRDWHSIVSGDRIDSTAKIMRLFLKAGACAYSFVIYTRNFLYSKDLLKSYALTFAGLKTTDRSQTTIPVISIGNITVGGTGKTPMVIWLCNFLSEKNINCAILTRGYKASAGKNDEPAMMIKNCPGTPVIVNPDRLTGALEAVKRHRAQVLIMDDGFQHRRLHRDVDIVTIDATQPFGYNKMLPAGLLREPVSSLKRAHAAVLTRCDSVSKDNLAKLTETVRSINPKIAVAQTVHQPVCAVTNDKREIPPAKLKGKTVFAFCGIANPDAFISTIGRLKAKLVGSKIYDDHYNYTAKDFDKICREAQQSKAELILTTEKDHNKITGLSGSKNGPVLAYLVVRMQFISGQEQITQLIERSLTGKISGKRTV